MLCLPHFNDLLITAFPTAENYIHQVFIFRFNQSMVFRTELFALLVFFKQVDFNFWFCVCCFSGLRFWDDFSVEVQSVLARTNLLELVLLSGLVQVIGLVIDFGVLGYFYCSIGFHCWIVALFDAGLRGLYAFIWNFWDDVVWAFVSRFRSAFAFWFV